MLAALNRGGAHLEDCFRIPEKVVSRYFSFHIANNSRKTGSTPQTFEHTNCFTPPLRLCQREIETVCVLSAIFPDQGVPPVAAFQQCGPNARNQ